MELCDLWALRAAQLFVAEVPPLEFCELVKQLDRNEETGRREED